MGLSLSSSRIESLLAVMRELARPRERLTMRKAIGPHLLNLFEAEYLAS